MDVTRTFKATLKTVRMRRKHMNEDMNQKVSNDLCKKLPDSPFKLRSREIARNISKLRDVIITHRNDYIGVFRSGNCMSETERDQIDQDAQTFMKSCSLSISSLKSEAGTKNQLSVHRKAVIQLLEEYLRAVCKLYGQQKAIRVKKAVDRKRMSRLNSMQSKDEKIMKKNPADLAKENRIIKTKAENYVKNVDFDPLLVGIDEPSPKPQDYLSKEEVQTFEEENTNLLNELNGLVDEVRHIEGKVIEISQLQEIFSEKVLDQASQIEKVHETTTSTTENVKEGNENIREAIKNSATFRVWILFFLVMCTFSLLFLDWYNQ